MSNHYEDEGTLAREVESGRARAEIGGLWDEMGALQFDFLLERGLRPEHRFLDLGCGCLRAGVRLAPYLDAGNYYGLDISPSLIEAGRCELDALGVLERVPAPNLRVTRAFDISGFPSFDYAIAQSLFTHLPLQQFSACLAAVRPNFTGGGCLFATFFTATLGQSTRLHERGGITTSADHDPFHFAVEDILRAAREQRWRANWIGEWGHPRDQQICELTVSDGG